MLRHLVTCLLQTYKDRLLTSDSSRLLSFPPKVIDHLESEECGRHDVDNASSPNENLYASDFIEKKKIQHTTRMRTSKQLHWLMDG